MSHYYGDDYTPEEQKAKNTRRIELEMWADAIRKKQNECPHVNVVGGGAGEAHCLDCGASV